MLKSIRPTAIPAIILGATLFALPAPSKADDQVWACTVALCVASPTSWRKINKCVKPVKDFLKCFKKASCSPPTCKKGGFSNIKYKPYKDCPSGYDPKREDSSKCIKVKEKCRGSNRDLTCSRVVDVISRPQNPKPYSIATANDTYYFNLD